MRIKQLEIYGFRNLQKTDISFDTEKNVYIFLGANGQGKTNLLEAIYLSALSKSFRTRTNLDLIAFSLDFCSIKTTFDSKSGEMELEVIVTETPNHKTLKINGVKKNAVDFVGNLKAVFFSPDDLAEMAFAPKMRRRYLDILLSLLDHEYLKELMHYQESLKQRNALLKSIRDGNANATELDFWDEKLAEYGLKIIGKRKTLLKQLTKLAEKHYQAISQSKDKLMIAYESEMSGMGDVEKYIEFLSKSRERDILTGTTTHGPHRDDLKFFLSDHDMTHFASRGEWRSLVLALKFAEIELIKERTGEPPILLLDDVFSELDEKRQKYLFKAISDHQTFITTTHKEFVTQEGEAMAVFNVDQGEIKMA